MKWTNSYQIVVLCMERPTRFVLLPSRIWDQREWSWLWKPTRRKKKHSHCQTCSFLLQRGVCSQGLACILGIYIRSPAIAEVDFYCVVHSGFACQSLHYYVVAVFEERLVEVWQSRYCRVY